MRVGMGYDVHRLVEGRDLIMGGVKIPYEKGLLGIQLNYLLNPHFQLLPTSE